MKKVLISAFTCCPNSGSEPGNGWNWVMGYAAFGMDVHCLTSATYKTRIEAYLKQSGITGLNIHYLDNKVAIGLSKIPIFGPYFHYYSWLWIARKRIKILIKKFDFSSAHHVTYSSIKLGSPIYNLKMKCILGPLGGGELPHKTLRKYLGQYFYAEYFKHKLSNIMARINPSVGWSINNADLILTSNEIVKKTIQRYGEKKTLQMFDAGLSEYFEKPFKKRDVSGKINLLWIGRFLPRKGLNLAIESISYLPEDFNFHLTIAGNGFLKGKAIELVKQLNLESKVTFIERLPHEQLPSLYEESHVLLFPSLIDSCPMQVFEAFALGLPVVTLAHQGMEDQVNDSRGVKVPVGKKINYPKELAKAMLNICKNEDLYNTLSVNAYQFGQKQIWKHRIKSFLENQYEK